MNSVFEFDFENKINLINNNFIDKNTKNEKMKNKNFKILNEVSAVIQENSNNSKK